MNKGDIIKYSATERLRDLRPVTIRAVCPDDKGLVAEALPGVSAESIQRRLFIRREITADDLKRITEVDFVNVVALVALLKKEGHYHIVGEGRYIRSGASVNGQRAEVAFLVEDAFQGLGIASLMFKHLVTIARRSGITQFEAEVLPTNEAMQKVFTRSGMPITRTATRDSVHVLMDLTGWDQTAALGRGTSASLGRPSRGA